jgi:hypothetical protein
MDASIEKSSGGRRLAKIPGMRVAVRRLTDERRN